MTSFIEQQQQQQQFSPDTQELVGEPIKKRSFLGKVVRSSAFKGVVFLAIFAATIPILLYFFFTEDVVLVKYTCVVNKTFQVPCGRPDVSSKECENISCCYDEKSGFCYHFIPSKYFYFPEKDTYKPQIKQTPFGNNATEDVSLTVVELDEDKLQIILHESSVNFEAKTLTNKKYDVSLHSGGLYVDVKRSETGESIFNTALGPLIVSKGFWEWTFQITTEHLYGLGEINFESNKTYTKVIYKNKDDHNTLPVFMGLINGKFHGIIVEHEGPLEVTVLPSKLVIVRSLVGNWISVTLSLGPTPADVVMQQKVKSDLEIPFWALGPHVCRRGSTTLREALDEYETFINNENNDIIYSSDCIHENLIYLINNANEEDKIRLWSAIDDLRSNSRLLLSIFPQILLSQNHLYETALALDMLYKINGEIFNGTFNGSPASYPDFLHSNRDEYLKAQIEDFPSEGYDGLVFTSNWPAEYSFEMKEEEFPYLSPLMLTSMSSTIPWNAIGVNNLTHIYKHNSYGSNQVKMFENINTTFVLTSSYNFGDTYAIHLENIDISWSSFKKAIATTLYNSIFGSSLISIPVCGSTDNYKSEEHEAICLRWYIFAAFSPIFRISSDLPRRDPSALISGTSQQAAKDAINKRNQLLPYLLSVLNSGEPLMRPMFYDYFSDPETLNLTEQYMIGSGLLIAQPVAENVTFLDVYLPPRDGVWYEFWGGRSYTELGWIKLHVLPEDWVTFLASGKIIPLFTKNSESPSVTLAVALKCTTNGCSASGTLNPTVGETMVFTANETGISVAGVSGGLRCDADVEGFRFIHSARIYGLEESMLVSSNFTEIDLCNADDVLYVKYFE